MSAMPKPRFFGGEMTPSSPKPPKKTPRAGSPKAKVPTPPKRLKAAGKRLWRDLHAELPAGWHYDARELKDLEAAAVLTDRLEQLNDAIDQDGLMVKGSTGQRVLNPAVVEARQVSAAISRHLGLIEIPNLETGKTETAATVRGRHAAKARWEKRDAWKAKAAEVQRRRRGEA